MSIQNSFRDMNEPELVVCAEYARAVAELSPRLFAYARSLTADAMLAEDKTQEALVRLLDKHDSYTVEDLPKLGFVAVRNLLIDDSRSARNRFDHDVDATELTGGLSDDNGLGHGLFDAFRKLSQTCRDTLSLLMNGLKQRDIAEITGAPVGTIASDVSRCRNKLAQELDL